MAQRAVSFDLFDIASGNHAPAFAPAAEHDERERELPEFLMTRHLKRPAETSPPVSPEKPRAAECVESDDELDPEDDDAPAPADVEERTRFAMPMGSDRERWEARQNASVVDAQILQGCGPAGCPSIPHLSPTDPKFRPSRHLTTAHSPDYSSHL